MKRAVKKNWIGKAQLIALSLIMVLMIGLCVDGLSIVSHAQSQGKVTASSANIRKEPNPNSQKVGSAERDDSVTINHQTTGTDGNIWYQVFVNANTLGYIRSDLVTITDGTTPTTATGSETTTTQDGVTVVEPVSASVTNGRNVRVRASASTTSQIVTTVENGLALTVTGQATASDNKVWYQVEFISNGAQVTGFIRSDYVKLSGDLTPVTENENTQTPTTTPEQPAEGNTGTEGDVTQPEETKKWETQLQGDKWYLLDMETPGQYEIDYLFNAVQQNGEAYEQSQETVKSQKIVIIVLVILVIILCAAVALAVYKIKDMKDTEYISRVERDAVRRRNAERPQSNQKVMHTVGAEKKPAPGGQNGRPQGGNRPNGGQPQGGSRPNGAQPQGGSRPNGGQPQGGSRPNGGQPQGGNRPNGGQPQGGNRPNGGQPQGGSRPNGGQPQGGNRPNGAQPQSGRPAGAQPVGERPVAPRPAAPKPVAQAPQGNKAQSNANKSKNFMTDDDEFEFEFLNWEGEEE